MSNVDKEQVGRLRKIFDAASKGTISGSSAFLFDQQGNPLLWNQTNCTSILKLIDKRGTQIWELEPNTSVDPAAIAGSTEAYVYVLDTGFDGKYATVIAGFDPKDAQGPLVGKLKYDD